ncbi:unnamed protein product [Closterium sp. NIES-65]|nr:unnamed protein product [Closterium sp. NIES-65]
MELSQARVPPRARRRGDVRACRRRRRRVLQRGALAHRGGRNYGAARGRRLLIPVSDAASAKASKAMDGVVGVAARGDRDVARRLPLLPQVSRFPSCHSPVIYLLSKSLNLTHGRVSPRSKKTRELLTASAGRTFLCEGASKRFHSITVRGPEGSVRYQAELCKGLAKKFDAALFLLDASFVHLLSQVPGSGFAYFTEKGDAAATLQASHARPSDLPGGERGWLCGSAGPDPGEAGGGVPMACSSLPPALLPARRERKVRAWEAMLKEQSHYMVCERNMQAIFLALKARKVTWDEDVADARFNFTAAPLRWYAALLAVRSHDPLSPVRGVSSNRFCAVRGRAEVEDIINMACRSRCLPAAPTRSCTSHATGACASLLMPFMASSGTALTALTACVLSIECVRLEYSLSLFFDEDGACHEKTAVTNGQVGQGKESSGGAQGGCCAWASPRATRGAGSKVGTPRGDALAWFANAGIFPAVRAGQDDNDFEKRIRPEILGAGSIGVTFESIGALESVKESLRELVLVPLKHPEIFNKGGLLQVRASDATLLGVVAGVQGHSAVRPAGTGKTMLAKAVARSVGRASSTCPCPPSPPSGVGEDEKNVRALFTLAEKVAPTVIFIDERFNWLGSCSFGWFTLIVSHAAVAGGQHVGAAQGGGEHEAMRKIKNEFMTHWDGLASKAGSRVLVLAATNRPFDLDEAIIRRFQRRVRPHHARHPLALHLLSHHGGAAGAGNRELILRFILQHEHVDADVDYCELAQLTEGFSGRTSRLSAPQQLMAY